MLGWSFGLDLLIDYFTIVEKLGTFKFLGFEPSINLATRRLQAFTYISKVLKDHAAELFFNFLALLSVAVSKRLNARVVSFEALHPL